MDTSYEWTREKLPLSPQNRYFYMCQLCSLDILAQDILAQDIMAQDILDFRNLLTSLWRQREGVIQLFRIAHVEVTCGCTAFKRR